MELCSRCGEPSQLKTRGELFCNDCFVSFLNIKFRKHLDIFRVNFMAESLPKLLVPVSCGQASIALADMVRQLLEYQRTKHGNRVGFTAQCVYIGDDEPKWPFDDMELIRLPKTTALAHLVKINGESFAPDAMRGLSRSSQQDLDNQLRGRILNALGSQFAATLMGYSMTRLSELVISETVKGRGAGIPDLVNPDHGRIYPLREITNTELAKYLDIRGLTDYVVPDTPPPAVTKLQSIDELVHSYFEGVQRDFPAVVSTVAKTASKLAQLPESCSLSGDANGTELCYACAVMLKTPQGRKQISVQSTQAVVDEFSLKSDST